MAERTVSRVLRLRTAFSSGLAAGERASRLWVSGSRIGSSQGPCTTNGSSNGGGARSAVAASAATPCRSKSRAGMEAEPDRPSRTFEPSRLTFSMVAMPSLILRSAVSFSNGVRPLRKSPVPDSGRRSSRRSNCSTFQPTSEPCRPVRLAVPFRVRVSAITLLPAASSVTATSPRPSMRRNWKMSPRHCSRSTSMNCSCDLNSAPASDAASATVPLSTPPNACDSPIVTRSLPPRRLAATAVRPSLARAMRDVRRRQPQVEIDIRSGRRSPAAPGSSRARCW